MDKFSTLTTGAVALEADNIDTDQIMPKQFLRGIDKAGLDKGLFYNLKHKADGSLNPDCVLNSSAAAKAAVISNLPLLCRPLFQELCYKGPVILGRRRAGRPAHHRLPRPGGLVHLGAAPDVAGKTWTGALLLGVAAPPAPPCPIGTTWWEGSPPQCTS